MSDCANLPKCPFFHDKMSGMPGMAELFKQNYCQGDSSRCARFLVRQKLGSGNVPGDLYPNELARAESILAE